MAMYRIEKSRMSILSLRLQCLHPALPHLSVDHFDAVNEKTRCVAIIGIDLDVHVGYDRHENENAGQNRFEGIAGIATHVF